MVDSQPNTGRHTFGDVPALRGHRPPHTPGDLDDVPFVDVRPTLGATCTLVDPLPDRAGRARSRRGWRRPCMYGIETEVSGYPREATHVDDGALALPVPAGRQGHAGPDPQRPAAAQPLRGACCRRCRARSSTTG